MIKTFSKLRLVSATSIVLMALFKKQCVQTPEFIHTTIMNTHKTSQQLSKKAINIQDKDCIDLT